MAKIDLGGETRVLRYSYTAISAAEREAGGVGIGKLCSGERVGFDSLGILVWAGLRHENKRRTRTTVEEWLDAYLETGGTIEALEILVLEALIEGHIVKRSAEGNG